MIEAPAGYVGNDPRVVPNQALYIYAIHMQQKCLGSIGDSNTFFLGGKECYYKYEERAVRDKGEEWTLR